MERLDVVIIGAGPAGISAAINAKIRNKSFMIFGGKGKSVKVEKSEMIDNYPGIFHISGSELNNNFHKHMDEMGITVEQEKITGIYDMGGYFEILTEKNVSYEARSIIFATGVVGKNEISGERDFLGMGVSYCATCDGNLYRGKTIAVVCDSSEMLEEVDYLSELAEKIYFFPMYKGELPDKSNVENCTGFIKEIKGDFKVRSVVLMDGSELETDGVFVLRQAVSADVLLEGLEMDNGHIVTARDMSTNIAGCFAAGDCTGRPYQIAKAVGEGNVALHSVISYLHD